MKWGEGSAYRNGRLSFDPIPMLYFPPRKSSYAFASNRAVDRMDEEHRGLLTAVTMVLTTGPAASVCAVAPAPLLRVPAAKVLQDVAVALPKPVASNTTSHCTGSSSFGVLYVRPNS